MLPPSFFEHYQDRLNLAVHDINQEYRMSVYHLKEMLGRDDVTMRYDGPVEIYKMGDVEVEAPAGASLAAIATALQNPFTTAFDDPKKKLRAI